MLIKLTVALVEGRLKSLIKRIKKWPKQIRYNWSLESCYNSMEDQGIAVFGMCTGVVGGDRSTEYLSIDCIDCPYYTTVPEIKEKED